HEAREVAAVPITGAALECRRDLGLRIPRDDLGGRTGEHQQCAPPPRTSPFRHPHRLAAPFKGDANVPRERLGERVGPPRRRAPAAPPSPSSPSHSSCAPNSRLTRASDALSSAGCRWAWPIAYPGNAPTQVDAGENATARAVSRVL